MNYSSDLIQIQTINQKMNNHQLLEFNELNYVQILNYFFELHYTEQVFQYKINLKNLKSLYGRLLNDYDNLVLFLDYFKNYLTVNENGTFILTNEMYFFFYLKHYLSTNINNEKITSNDELKKIYESMRTKVQVLDFLPKLSESKKMLIKYLSNESNLLKLEFFTFQKVLYSNKFVLYIYKTNNSLFNKNIYEYQNNLCRLLNLVEENKNLVSIQFIFELNKNENNQMVYSAPLAFKNLPYLNCQITINSFIPENNNLLSDFNIDIVENSSMNILENFKSNKIIDFNQLNTYGVLIPYYFSFSYTFMKSKLIIN